MNFRLELYCDEWLQLISQDCTLWLWMRPLFKSPFEFGAHRAVTNIHACIELMMWLSCCVCLGIFMLMTWTFIPDNSRVARRRGRDGARHYSARSNSFPCVFDTIIAYKLGFLYDWLHRSVLRWNTQNRHQILNMGWT